MRLDGDAAGTVQLQINLSFTDLNESWVLSIDNGVLRGVSAAHRGNANLSLTLSSMDFKRLMSGMADPASLMGEDKLSVQGDVRTLLELSQLFVRFPRRYPIVTPRT